MTTAKRYRIFVLGAGFSRSAGLPLAGELWAEIFHRARALTGRASKLMDDVEDYLKYRKRCDGLELTAEQMDFEDFLAFLDVEHRLGLRGSDTWSEDGNEGQVVVKSLIGRILTERCPAANSVPSLYLRFASLLRPDDVVLSFNYDVLLERALDAIGKPYRLFPDRYESVSEYSGAVDNSKDEVVILKVHGSIDWFDRAGYRRQEAEFRRQGVPHPPEHVVFSNIEALGVTPLTDGPRFANDPLREVHRVRDIGTLYAKDIMFRATPRLLSPSSAKLIYHDTMGDFWQGLGGAGSHNFGLAVIGYSLPDADDYAHRVLYRIVSNYQQTRWGEEHFGLVKTPFVLIDKCEAEGAPHRRLLRRYAFVDWGRARPLVMTGFDEAAVALLERGV